MPPRSRAYWISQGVGWSVYAVLNAGLYLLVAEPEWKAWGLFFVAVLSALGLAATHGYRAFIRRRGWARLSLWRLAPRVLAACVLLAVATMLAFKGLDGALAPWQPAPDPEKAGRMSQVAAYVSLTVNMGSVYLLWSLLYFGLHYLWHYRQAEVDKWKLDAQAKAAKLKALELQLNPHFFFNSLNSVRALIVEDPARAQTAVTRLAALLRYTLQAGKTTTVPLRRELKTVRTYLELEGVRFEERLRTRIDADEAALDHPVPLLLVQTLAENAIKHGIAPRPDGGTVAITARAEPEGGVRLRVENTGRLGTRAETGVGLANARERLRLLFGADATLTVEETGDGTVAACVRIPAPVATRLDRRAAASDEPPEAAARADDAAVRAGVGAER